MSKRCFGCMQIYEGGSVCPHCGYVEGTPPEEAIHLMPGTRLRGRYTVGRTLGYGGFGATYIGFDEILQQRVAIKEYMPSEFATRVPGESRVMVFEGDKNEQFHDGMRKFVDEARRLAKFQDEPGIITIYDAFEENDTAYNVMEYLEGETLASYMERTGIIPEDTAVMIMTPIMESLKAVHAEGILHRDIAPENIFLTMDGRVKLIDFGASRYATTSHSRSLTVIIKPGYSPEEQYRSRGDQGPYTDVYAVAAVLYKMITGKTPPDALERRAMYENKNKDILIEPHKLNKDISQVRETAIMNALNVRIEDRTPDITAFLSELNANEPAKRRYGSIMKINFFKMPLWMKIAVPAALAAFAAFAVLIATGAIDFSRFSQTIVIPDGVVVVPEVEGLMSDQAISDIEGSRLLAVTAGNVESEYIPAGKIVYQTPTGGSYLALSGKVELMISSGKDVREAVNGIATVPYLQWSVLEDAVEKLKRAGLGEPVIEEVYDDNVAAGQVISQSIDFGEEVAEGTVLTLQVSLGPKGFEMPDLTGLTEEQAKEKLIELGLSVTVSYVKDDSLPEGKITSQDIAPGTEVRRGDSVVITAAAKEETIAVADVGGMTKNDAKKVLQDLGFKVTVLGNYSDTVEKGKVISQDPQDGTKLKNGSTVTIYVSKGSETTEETTTRKAAEETTKAPETTTAAPLQKYTVTFNGNGGTTPGSITVTAGSTYGSLPTPSRTGYGFAGWYTAKDGGTQVSNNTAVTGNITLYAHWKGDSYILFFNAAGGSVSPASKSLKLGNAYGDLPKPTRTGYTFKGWFTAADGGSQVSSSTTMGAGDVTVYAHWKAASVTVTFDPQGGTVDEGSRTLSYGDKYGALPTPKRPYYVFTGWFTGAGGSGSAVSADTKVSSTSNITLYAGWSMKGYSVSWNDDPHCVITVKRTQGSSTGTLSNGATIYAGDVLSVSYKAKDGYYVEDHGPSEITVSGNVTSDKIYAITAAEEYVYTLVYAAESGATLGTEDIVGNYGSSVTVTLPVYSGLYSDKTEEVVTFDQLGKTIYITYHAHQYTINWNDAANVSISVRRETSPYKGAAAGNISKGAAIYYGDTFTVTYTPASGYTLADHGLTSFTEDGFDVTSSHIYAAAGSQNVTYNIVYKSSNGTSLGSSTATYAYGTTNTISAPGYSGYATPGSQTVAWDSLSAKTITFTYTPNGVSAQYLCNNKWWWNNGDGNGIKCTAYVTYSNRTASSVTVNVVWVQSITAKTWYGFAQYTTVSVGNGSSGKQTINSTTAWNQTNHGSNSSAASVQRTWSFNVSGLSATQTSISYSVNCSSQGSSSNAGSWSGTIAIPAY